MTGSTLAAGLALDGAGADSLVAAPGANGSGGWYVVGGSGTPVLPPPPSPPAPPPPPPSPPPPPPASPPPPPPATPPSPPATPPSPPASPPAPPVTTTSTPQAVVPEGTVVIAQAGTQAGEAAGQEGNQEEASALPAQEGEAEVPHGARQAREGEARAVPAAAQDCEGGEGQVVLRRPGYALGLVAAIVGFGVFSSSIGSGALPDTSVPPFGLTNGTGSLSTVAQLGDVNGDNIGDYAVGLPSANADAGVVYVFLGHAGALPPTPTALNPASASYTITGHAGEMLGFSITGEDMNNDGRNDVVIGAPMAGAPSKSGGGAVYVIFGSANPGNVATASLYAGGGLTNDPISPAAHSAIGSRYDGIVVDAHTGYAVAALGDVNGDGFGDVAVGAPDGSLHIPGGGGLIGIYGKPQGEHIDLSDLWDKGYPYWFHADFPTQDALSLEEQPHLGRSVALVGDVTGDGWPDIAVGAPQASFNGRLHSGSVWIVSGHLPPIDAGCVGMVVDNSCPWIRLWQLSQAPIRQAYRIDGAQAGDGLGSSIAGVGDQNGDGIPDIAIGESSASPVGRQGAGAVVVVPGQRQGAVRDLAASPPLQRIYGPEAGAGLGASLAAAGDVDGDGHVDMLIGSPGEASHTGAAYLLRGVSGATSDLANPSTKVVPAGVGAQAGSAVAAGLSLDGGNRDALIAAPGANGSGGWYLVGGTGTPILPSGIPPVPPAQPAAPPAAPGTTPKSTTTTSTSVSSGTKPAVKAKKKKLPLCPLKKPKPKYHTVKGKRVKVKPKPCRPLTAKQKALLRAKAKAKAAAKAEGQGQGEGEGRSPRPAASNARPEGHPDASLESSHARQRPATASRRARAHTGGRERGRVLEQRRHRRTAHEHAPGLRRHERRRVARDRRRAGRHQWRRHRRLRRRAFPTRTPARASCTCSSGIRVPSRPRRPPSISPLPRSRSPATAAKCSAMRSPATTSTATVSATSPSARLLQVRRARPTAAPCTSHSARGNPRTSASTQLYPAGYTNNAGAPATPSAYGSRYDSFGVSAHTGMSLAALPDVNGDGYRDIAVGLSRHEHPPSGRGQRRGALRQAPRRAHQPQRPVGGRLPLLLPHRLSRARRPARRRERGERRAT